MMSLEQFEKDFIKMNDLNTQNDFTGKVLRLLPEDIKKNCTIKTLKQGEQLVRMQDPVKFVHIIIDGSFSVVNEFESGRSYEPLATYESDFIGVVEVSTNTKEYFANVRAKKPSKVIEMSITDFNNWIASNNEAALLVLESVCKNFKLTMEHSGEEMVLNSMYIFVRHLLRTSVQVGEDFKLDEGREVTSRRTGINIRTMYRHINKLKKMKFITIEKRRIHFTNEQKDKLMDYYHDLRN